MSSGVRGRCLIINNEHFEMKKAEDQADLTQRRGSKVDTDNIERCMHRLNFEVTVKRNVKSDVSM